MQYDPSQITTLMGEKITELLAKRNEHLVAVDEIDGQLRRVFQALDVDPASFGVGEGDNRLPRTDPLSRYPLDPNTLGGAMMGILAKTDRGLTPREIRTELEKDQRFAARLKRSPNQFYNLIHRYKDKSRIVAVGGLVYAANRAPLPEGEDDPSGQHLPSNVSSLFASRKNIDA